MRSLIVTEAIFDLKPVHPEAARRCTSTHRIQAVELRRRGLSARDRYLDDAVGANAVAWSFSWFAWPGVAVISYWPGMPVR